MCHSCNYRIGVVAQAFNGRGDSSMPSVVTSSKDVLPDKARVSPWRVAPTVAGVVARASCRACRDIESLRGRMPLRR